MQTHDTASDRLQAGNSLGLRHFFLGAGISLWAEGSCADTAARGKLGMLFLILGGSEFPN